jgi:uroporphyrinogen III methyltransferase/synthase
MEALLNTKRDVRALGNMQIATLGPGTADALKPYALKADIMPKSNFIAEGLIEVLLALPRGHCLLPRAEVARDILPQSLLSLGFTLTQIALYETKTAPWPDFPEHLSFQDPAASDDSSDCQNSITYDDATLTEFVQSLDVATLTSASTAQGLAAHIPKSLRSKVQTISIGPITTKEAQSLGFTVVREAQKSTIDYLLQAIVTYCTKS